MKWTKQSIADAIRRGDDMVERSQGFPAIDPETSAIVKDYNGGIAQVQFIDDLELQRDEQKAHALADWLGDGHADDPATVRILVIILILVVVGTLVAILFAPIPPTVR